MNAKAGQSDNFDQQLAQARQRIADLESAQTRHQATEEQLLRVEQELRQANMRLSDALIQIKKSQQQLVQYERMMALCQMARGFAHEFNNSLMPILGFSELMLTTPSLMDDPKELKEMIQDIHSAAKEAAETIRCLRDFYQSGNDSRQFSWIDLNSSIRQSLHMTQPRWKEEMQAGGNPIHIVSDLQEDTLHVNGVESQILDVFVHVIINSIDAMPQGGTITIRSRNRDTWVEIDIQDTGIGMTPDILRRAMEPFYTTKGSTRVGLGLSLAYGTVRRHGGMLELESQPGKGTTVRIRLPGQKEPSATGEAGGAESLPPLRVLVIDDDPWSHHVTSAYFTQRGHTAETAESGKEGIDKFERQSFDLVIVDRAMPDLSGDQVARILKERRPGLPVIMLTGFGAIMENDGEHPSGVDAILGKPTTEQELFTVVAQVWARAHPSK